MQRFSYSERDYAFGQAMLSLHTAIGLTQAGLAELLGVSRKAISRWEAGDTYPKAEHLKALLAFAVRQQAFAAGREEEEIRAFWRAAHQKMLLDERWLQEQLSTQHPRLTLVVPQHVEERSNALQIMAQSVPQPRVDWSDALAVPSFYGRTGEVAMLMQWVVEEHCRVVSVLGLGGIGKSALAVSLMHQVAPHFEVVIWRSLRDAPACEAVLDQCLQVLAPGHWALCRPPSNDAWVSLWSTCVARVPSWCWTIWRRCWRKAWTPAACVPATKAMASCCAGWPRPSTRVAMSRIPGSQRRSTSRYASEQLRW
jgi:transcriptional regulator with XRE-family HTH domain